MCSSWHGERRRLGHARWARVPTSTAVIASPRGRPGWPPCLRTTCDSGRGGIAESRFVASASVRVVTGPQHSSHRCALRGRTRLESPAYLRHELENAPGWRPKRQRGWARRGRRHRCVRCADESSRGPCREPKPRCPGESAATTPQTAFLQRPDALPHRRERPCLQQPEGLRRALLQHRRCVAPRPTPARLSRKLHRQRHSQLHRQV